MFFDNFSLLPSLQKSLTEMGHTKPTQIQEKAIPHIAAGGDVRGSAPTGTGKTGAFLLPSLHRLASAPKQRGPGPRLLVLVPTRELGMQIAKQSERYSKYLSKVRTVCIGGGVPYPKQIAQLRRPYEVLVATPGRLLDLIERNKISFPRLELCILDEADMMLDMGFLPSVEKIFTHVPQERQTLLFSATMHAGVEKLSRKLLQDPIDVTVAPEKNRHETIVQSLYYAEDRAHKCALLDRLLEEESWESMIIFTATKMQADQLASNLSDKGHKAEAFHGDMHQRKRTKTMRNMRDGRVDILVATDVAARGIDIDSISHVINFDLPRTAADYVHRIGRTGRAEAKGCAISMAFFREKRIIEQIEALTQKPLAPSTLAGLEPSKKKLFGKKVRPSFFKKKKGFSKRPFR
ncbi:MAG: DEAD/DEAH box helicase [Chlamydiota bacterium]